MSHYQNVKDVLRAFYQYSETPFTLSSGQQSHEYVNCRRALGRPEVLGQVVRLLDNHCEDPDTIAVGGLTMGADPLAIAMAIHTGRRWFAVRKEPKRGDRFSGDLHRGDAVVLVEDVVTTGESLMVALDCCHIVGAEVREVVALVDRSDPDSGLRRIKDRVPHARIVSLFTMSDLRPAIL